MTAVEWLVLFWWCRRRVEVSGRRQMWLETLEIEHVDVESCPVVAVVVVFRG